MYAATPQRSRISSTSSRVSSSRRPSIQQIRFTHVEIFTKERPLPKAVKHVQPKGFIACQSKVNLPSSNTILALFPFFKDGSM